jgi:hypothetical protein
MSVRGLYVQRTDGKFCLLSLELAAHERSCDREQSLCTRGYDVLSSAIDLVQKLSLESLAWELMQFRLPFADSGIPCFKLRNTEVYLVVKNTLYCSNDDGAAHSYKIGSLSN